MTRFLLVLLLLVPVVGRATSVFLTPEQALKLLFRTSERVDSQKKTLTAETRARIEADLRTSLAKETWTFYIGQTKGRVDGYAVIDHEIGKSEPITFVTKITPEGRVDQVEILVYREPIGGEVRERRFLNQFVGLGGKDPVRVGKDIRHITGATMSSRAVANGVKRALKVWQEFYGR